MLSCISAGINLIDTSPWYGHGKSETVLGKALEGQPRQAYYLMTKVGQYSQVLLLVSSLTYHYGAVATSQRWIRCLTFVPSACLLASTSPLLAWAWSTLTSGRLAPRVNFVKLCYLSSKAYTHAQVHDPEFCPNLDIICSETLPALAKAKAAGKIRHIGITGEHMAACMHAY